MLIIYLFIGISINLAETHEVFSARVPYQVWSESINGNEEIFFKYESWGKENAVRLTYLNGLDVAPVVLEDANALIRVVWSNVNGDQSLLFHSTSQDGVEWSSPQKIPTGMKINSAPALALDGNNRLWLFWSGSQKGSSDDIYSLKLDGGIRETPLRVHATNSIPDILPQTRTTAAGEMAVVWMVLTQEGYKKQAAKWEQSQWVRQDISAFETEYQAKGCPLNDNPYPSTAVIFNRLNENRTNKVKAKQANVAGTEQNYDEFFLTFGDSITFGNSSHGYQGELGRILSRNGRNAKIYNLGKQGETTVEGLNRLNYLLAEVPTDYLLLLEGANDLRFGISQQTTMANLGAMLDNSVAANVEPIIANLTPDGTNGGYNRAIANSYNPQIKALADRKRMTFSDQYTPLSQNWGDYTDDGLHPNSAGYRMMANTWYDAIVVLGQKPRVTTRAPAEVQATNATLSALVTPNGTETRCYFEYGDGDELVFNSEEIIIGAQEPETPVEITIYDLEPLTQYRYRAVAVNETGNKSGGIKSFQTIEKDPDTGGSGCFMDTINY